MKYCNATGFQFIFLYLDFPRKENYDRKWKTIMIVNKGNSCIKMNNISKGKSYKCPWIDFYQLQRVS